MILTQYSSVLHPPPNKSGHHYSLHVVEITMVLCDACTAIDFRQLLSACLVQCRDRQAAGGKTGVSACSPGESNIDWHHGDICEVGSCAPACDLCNDIFQWFERNCPCMKEDTRGVPLAFRPYENKIELCYNTGQGLIAICRLDIYMDTATGE